MTRKFSHAVQVMRAASFLPSQAPVVEVTPADPENPLPTVTVSNQDFDTAVDMVFREDPYLAKRPEVFAARVQDLTGVPVTLDRAKQAIKGCLAHLRGLVGKMNDPALKEYRIQIRQRWMVAFMREAIANTGRTPKYKDLYVEAQLYFGATLDAGTIQRYIALATAAPVTIPMVRTEPKTVIVPAPIDEDDGPVVAPPGVGTETLQVLISAGMQEVLDAQAKQLGVIQELVGLTTELRAQVADLKDQLVGLRASVSASLSDAETAIDARLSVLETTSPPEVERVAPDPVGMALAKLVASGLVVRIEAA